MYNISGGQGGGGRDGGDEGIPLDDLLGHVDLVLEDRVDQGRIE